jgi:hypothetical protein
VNRTRFAAGAALIAILYLGLGLTNALSRAPWCDEAWFASPAYNLAYHGFMGTTVLDPLSSTWKSVKLTGIDRHTYWAMPLNLLWNAAAFRVFGFSVYTMRLLSLLWGLLALCAWGAILWKLSGRLTLVLGGVLLISIDYHFLMQASDGRMDAMAVALGWSGVAAYLLLREGSFAAAVIASQTLAAMSLFTHPNGFVLALISAVTALYFDRRCIRVATVAIAAVPYLLLAGGWALYIARDPADFATQLLGNASGRGPTITTPLAALKLEIENRYLWNFGLAGWSSLAGRLNAIPLAIFIAGVAVCLAVREIRQQPGYRLVLIWTAIVVFYLTELEGLKTPLYLIYVTPLYSILLAIAVGWCWRRAPRYRVAVGAVMVLFVALQAARTPIADSRNPRRTTFDPAVRYLRAHYNPSTLIMGGAGLMFGLGPDWKLLDDIHLGYESGKRADVIVVDPRWTDGMEMQPAVSRTLSVFVQHMLESEYQEVDNRGGYRILVRRSYAGAR